MNETLYIEEKELELVDFDGANDEIYQYQGKPFTGFIRSTFSNGAPICDLEYINGYREGAYIEYFGPDLPGKKSEEIHEKFGTLNGEYKRWNRLGELLYHAYWQDGEEVEVYFGRSDNYNY